MKKKRQPTIVDNTRLSSLADCKTRTAVVQVLGLRPIRDAPELRCGIDVHTAFASWMVDGDAEKALRVFKKAYREWGRKYTTPEDARWPDHVERILEHYWEMMPREKFPMGPIGPDDVELGLVAPLVDGVLFVALIDAWGKLRVGGWWPMDNKTGGRLSEYWVETQKDSAQFTGQKWLTNMCREVLGHPTSGILVNGIELKTIPGSERKCWVHKVPYSQCGIRHVEHRRLQVTRTPAEVNGWYKTAVHLAGQYQELVEFIGGDRKKVREVDMDGRFNGSCWRCSLREWCRYGREVGKLEQYVELEPWQPLKRAARLIVDGKETGKLVRDIVGDGVGIRGE